MKFQVCKFKRLKNSKWEKGIAKVKAFGLSDVDWIIDENGIKRKKIWDYKLDSFLLLGKIDNEYYG